MIRHPIARVTVDGRRFTSAEAAVGAVEIRLALGNHDAARIALWRDSSIANASPDARASIALGDPNDVIDVWSGMLASVESGDRRVVLDGLSHTVRLSRQRLARTWQEQSVQDIVRDLAGDVDVDAVDASLRLPWYAVDTRRTVWSHVRELAELVGADVAPSASGAVRFVPARTTAEVHELRYGADLIRWRLDERPSSATRGVRAYGAGSEAGAQQWHWLLGDSGSAPSGGTTVPGALRTRDAAESSAQARVDRAGRQAHQATVLALGCPSVRPGDTVRLVDVPELATDRYRVVSLVHRLDGRQGFTTSLRMEGAAA